MHDYLGFVDMLAKENDKDPTTLTDEENTAYMEEGRDHMMAIHIFMRAVQDCFSSAIEDFEHAYLMDKKNRYPKNTHECYTLLKGWRKAGGKQYNPTGVGLSFNLWATKMRRRQQWSKTGPRDIWALHSIDVGEKVTLPKSASHHKEA